jgi:hypothetical protein
MPRTISCRKRNHGCPSSLTHTLCAPAIAGAEKELPCSTLEGKKQKRGNMVEALDYASDSFDSISVIRDGPSKAEKQDQSRRHPKLKVEYFVKITKPHSPYDFLATKLFPQINAGLGSFRRPSSASTYAADILAPGKSSRCEVIKWMAYQRQHWRSTRSGCR